jgi:hypothetical protein
MIKNVARNIRHDTARNIIPGKYEMKKVKRCWPEKA